MLGSVSAEREVKVAASEAWEAFISLRLANILEDGLPRLFTKIDILEGDGSVGTIIHVFFRNDVASVVESYKEKVTVVDNKKRVKVAETVEGGYLNLGFNLYRTRVEVIEKEEKENECIVRVTVEYQLKHEAAANVSLVSIEPFAACLQVIADHMHGNSKTIYESLATIDVR